MKNFKEKANFLWSIADLLRGPYKPADYGNVILPFTVLRRLDVILEPTQTKSVGCIQAAQGQEAGGDGAYFEQRGQSQVS